MVTVFLLMGISAFASMFLNWLEDYFDNHICGAISVISCFIMIIFTVAFLLLL